MIIVKNGLSLIAGNMLVVTELYVKALPVVYIFYFLPSFHLVSVSYLHCVAILNLLLPCRLRQWLILVYILVILTRIVKP